MYSDPIGWEAHKQRRVSPRGRRKKRSGIKLSNIWRWSNKPRLSGRRRYRPVVVSSMMASTSNRGHDEVFVGLPTVVKGISFARATKAGNHR